MHTLLFRAMALIVITTLSSLTLAGSSAGHHDQTTAEADAQGPHGGTLLRDGAVSVELAIVEQGTPPQYRAWITHAGKAVSNARLSVTLTRLGGRQETFRFHPQDDHWQGDGVVGEPHSFDVSLTLQLAGQTYAWQWPAYEGRVQIQPQLAARQGITSAVAGAGQLQPEQLLYGRLHTPPEQSARIQARFPGLITRVFVNSGDRVQPGARLAEIESNDSLQRYTLQAPIAGVVQQRNASAGELSGDQPLFVLLDNRTLWAELQVFPGQRHAIQAGQSVTLSHGERSYSGQIRHLLPATGTQPYARAIVVLDNPHEEWMSGDQVSARVVTARTDVPLVVDNRALQAFRDWTVVFVQVGDTYEIRPLELGRSDARVTEVLSGLQPGDRYVVGNSYLIKADIEKSGASHDH